jgi:pimeloyl-ACP methyl ester carboxylesterase
MNNSSFPLYHEAHGDPNHPCIMLINGLGAQLIQWPEMLIEGLVNKGLYVVTFDNRDSGLSHHYDHLGIPNLIVIINSKQECRNFKLPYTLKDMADDVVMLMDKLLIQKAHILGISMGGIIAQIFALNNPKRVSSLILLETTSGDTHLPSAKPEVHQFFSLPISENLQRENLESYVERQTKLYQIYNPNFFNEQKTRELLTELYKRAYNPDGFKRQLSALICAEPRGERLKQLQIKSLIIHGSDDPAFPLEHGKYLADCIPYSRIEIIERLGHGLPDEFGDKIAAVIVNFINEKKNF